MYITSKSFRRFVVYFLNTVKYTFSAIARHYHCQQRACIHGWKEGANKKSVGGHKPLDKRRLNPAQCRRPPRLNPSLRGDSGDICEDVSEGGKECEPVYGLVERR